MLLAVQAGIEISYVSFEGSSADPDENTRRLVEAIADARLVPQRRGGAEPRMSVADALPSLLRSTQCSLSSVADQLQLARRDEAGMRNANLERACRRGFATRSRGNS